MVAGVILWSLCFANTGIAQIYRGGTIDAGTSITVRTNERIEAKDADGRVYSGVVEQDVMSRNGNIAIPKGSDVEMVVRETGSNQYALDLDSVKINGQRYSVQSDTSTITGEKRDGLGANKRTGEYVGGGAVLGAIIGAIAGGGKGAAIGAGAGAAAGAGAQILTRGKSVQVPAESLVTFRLQEPLRAGIADGGYNSNGVHYHPRNTGTYSNDTSSLGRQKPSSSSYSGDGTSNVAVGSDNNIRWNGPRGASVYVQVDNEREKLFAAGQSGTQEAPWITEGHVYIFTVRDRNGNEVAHNRYDTRSTRRYFRR